MNCESPTLSPEFQERSWRADVGIRKTGEIVTALSSAGSVKNKKSPYGRLSMRAFFVMVGAGRFERPTSCSQGRHANQTALRPDWTIFIAGKKIIYTIRCLRASFFKSIQNRVHQCYPHLSRLSDHIRLALPSQTFYSARTFSLK